MNRNQMKVLIDQIIECRKKRAKRGQISLPAPASASAIQAFEKEEGWTLPPSYKVFLSLYDGWYEPRPGSSLIGIRGHWRKKLAENVVKRFSYHFWMKDLVKRFPDSRSRLAHLKSLGAPFKPGQDLAVAQRDETARAALNKFLKAKRIIGGNLEGSYYCFDENKRRANGEMPLVHYDLRFKDPQRGVFRDFEAFLVRKLAIEQSLSGQ